jgi:hypothetical protein
MMLGSLTARAARSDDLTSSAKWSAALCGMLDAGMIEAEGRGHGRFDASAQLKVGRGDEYRRRAAREALAVDTLTLATVTIAPSAIDQSHFATSAH